jgi:two-component system response regulator HydG
MQKTPKGHILVVDDEPSMRTTLSILLRREGYDVSLAGNGAEALEALSSRPFDMVLTDLKMEPVDGMELLRRAKKVSPMTEVLIFTAYGTVDSAVEAMKVGAYDYIGKPFDEKELVVKVARALEHRSLVREIERLKEELKSRKGVEGDIIAKSRAMVDVLSKAAQVAPSEATVLIEGESGTGKELVAAIIHQGSSRHSDPFIAVNCSNLSETLLESELFGHEKGAFTGAERERRGLFEAADGGTLLFDEIGDMPPALQGKFLRVLQEGEVRKLGSSQAIRVDVRILAATNRNLDSMVNSGHFREDLFYRLNVVRIHIPPLRERPEDIIPLAHHFLEIYRKKTGREIKGFSRDAVKTLLDHTWPGNVRELENAVERGVILAGSSYISPEDFSIQTSSVSPKSDDGKTLRELQKRHIIDALERHGGNRAKAAKELGIGRNTLWRWLSRKDFQV